jgi:probable rRNA maturation factor
VDIVIQIDAPFSAIVKPEQIEQAVLTAFHLCPIPKGNEAGTVSVVITDNDTVQQLNYQYRDIDAPTDVLSFESIPDPDFPGDESQVHLGDIVIAYPMAESQAATAGHTPLEEVILLAVHGTLHLLGFDHDSPISKKEMWTVQHRIMVELGLDHIQPTVV